MLGRARLSRHLCRELTGNPPGGARLSALKPSSDYTSQPSTTQIATKCLIADRITGADPQLVRSTSRLGELHSDVQVAILSPDQLHQRDPQRAAALLDAEEHRPEHRRGHVLEDELRVFGAQAASITDARDRLLVQPYAAGARLQPEIVDDVLGDGADHLHPARPSTGPQDRFEIELPRSMPYAHGVALARGACLTRGQQAT